MGKKRRLSKEGLNRGAWTKEEDRILKAYVKAHGEGKWSTMPTKAGTGIYYAYKTQFFTIAPLGGTPFRFEFLSSNFFLNYIYICQFRTEAMWQKL